MAISTVGPLSRLRGILRPPAPQVQSKPAPAIAETRAPSTLIALPGLRPGSRLAVQQGVYDGTNFGGEAVVQANDGRTLDLLVQAQAMFVRVGVRLRLALQPDGRVRFEAGRDGEAPTTSMLKIRSQKPGLTVLEAPDGGQVKLQATPQGGLAIAYDQSRIVLKP